MIREGKPQYGVKVSGSVTASEDIDLRGFSGGCVAMTGGSGDAEVWVLIGGAWKQLTVDQGVVTIALGAGAEVMPDAMFHAGLVRLVGPNGTVDIEPKS